MLNSNSNATTSYQNVMKAVLILGRQRHTKRSNTIKHKEHFEGTLNMNRKKVNKKAILLSNTANKITVKRQPTRKYIH